MASSEDGVDGSQATRRPDPAGIVDRRRCCCCSPCVIFWDTSDAAARHDLRRRARRRCPIVIATGLALLAVGNSVLALRGEFPERESFDPKAIVLILGGLAALIAIIGLGGGFIPATTILFAATADGVRPPRDPHRPRDRLRARRRRLSAVRQAAHPVAAGRAARTAVLRPGHGRAHRPRSRASPSRSSR